MGKMSFRMMLSVGYLLLHVAMMARLSAQNVRVPIFPLSEYSESHPVVSVKEDDLFLSIHRHPVNFGLNNHADIWLARPGVQSGFSRPVNAAVPLNDEGVNMPMALSLDGNTLYLWNKDQAESPLAFSQRQGRNWQTPQPMHIEGWNMAQIRLQHWHVSIDGQFLFLAAITPETNGQEDIFLAIRKNSETWGSPKRLGAPLNSAYREASVFLAADGRSLYFASDRRGGLGGLDLYVTQRLDDSWTNWSNPRNLGPQINSEEDESQISLPASGELAYFVVGQTGGDSRIYSAPLPVEYQPLSMVLLTGTLRDRQTGQPVVSATVCLQLFDGDKILSSRCGIRPDRNGIFQMLIPQSQTVAIYAEKKGYLSGAHYFTPDGAPGGGEDQEEALLNELFQRDSYYRTRESEIKALQEQSQALENLITSMDQMRQAELTRLAQRSYVSVLQPFEYDMDRTLLRSRYEATRAQYTGDAPILGNIPQIGDAGPQEAAPAISSGINVYPETVQGRIQALRERQQLKRNNPEPAGSTSPPASAQLYDFERFFQALENVIVQELQDSVLLLLEKELLPSSISSLRGSLTDTQIPIFDAAGEQAKRAVFSAEYESPFKNLERYNPPPANNPVRQGWQQPIADTLRSAMTQPIAEKLMPSLKNAVRAYQEFDLLYALYTAQRYSLASRMDMLTQRQIAAERGYRKKLSSSPQPPLVYEDTLTVSASKERFADIWLHEAGAGSKVRLENVCFDPNTADLLGWSLLELQRLAALLEQFPDLCVQVETHTNGLCTYSFADELTQVRAVAIKQYLLDQGIDPQRIQAEGRGKSMPVASNSTPEGRRANQRIEISFFYTPSH